ncbi:MAG: 50S ribosomal protein L32 [Parcubacteria group bacterium]|nr:50S ribosomal protein L32 [Parcubacteria group bacterium]
MPPTQRHTKSRKNKRRAHLQLSLIRVTLCVKCGKPVLMHRACTWCGSYRGREVIDVLAKLDKKERKKKQREIQQAEREQEAQRETLPHASET